MQKSATLVTIGDAVASFLECPDTMTQGRCLMSKDDVNTGALQWRLEGCSEPNTRPPAVAHREPHRRLWFAAASKRRWLSTIGFGAVALLVAMGFLVEGYNSVMENQPGESPFKLALGRADSRSLMPGVPRNLIEAVLLANLPQLIISIIYLNYNGLLTSMLLSHEWSSKSSFFRSIIHPLHLIG